jgi:ATP-dependent phosphofructokinase / diphosphate-dependent phosphofructokinase
MAKKIAILTAGGDCPGLNAAIRGVGKTAIVNHGMEVIGFTAGFSGLIRKEYVELDEPKLSGILTLGGTILGTSREKPFKIEKGDDFNDKPSLIKNNYEELGLDCVVCIGGNGTMKTAHLLALEGMNVIGIPKTIDNDVYGTEITFGFDSAVSIATEAIDRLHSTANSHQRAMVIEVMGHHAGWIALYAGLAGGGDIILIPEIKYNIKSVCKSIEERFSKGKTSAIVVIAEGIEKPDNMSAAAYLSDKIQRLTGIEARETRLGYVQRGGSPSALDRILATRYGAYAAELIAEGQYGQMVTVHGGVLGSIPLAEVGNKLRLVDPMDSLIVKARNMAVLFGDEKVPSTV